ncbi:UNVERIFIED_CONTAM: hypothetical protein GTU68_051496 [Idotea baltica]|nr:hypothetical protein [Idotea baltica]
MALFTDFKISTPLRNALDDLGFKNPTAVQEQTFPVVMSGKDIVGIAQTGTGKTFAYLLPILNALPFSKEKHPRVLILVPTRELVVQVVEETEKLGKYTSVRVLGVYGGTSMNRQKDALAQGADVIVATPARLYELAEFFSEEICIIHSNKTQNYRLRSIQQFDSGKNRILVTTDVMARGLDLDQISHVINFDVPLYPENYMHRIGRTGRAEKEGTSILLYTDKEEEAKNAIEDLMSYQIKIIELPAEVKIATQLTYDEQPKHIEHENPLKINEDERGAGFHEKSEKNKKQNQGGSYRRIIEKKYKKPKTRGDKNLGKKRKR